MAANILPRGGFGTGVNIEGRNYPLVDPTSDIRGLLSDIYLNHPQDVALPLRIRWVYGFSRYLDDDPDSIPDVSVPAESLPGDHAADLEIVDADDVIVFNTIDAETYKAQDFGTRLRVHEWATADRILRVVQHTAFEDEEDVVAFPMFIEPVAAELDARTSEKRPLRVDSLQVATTVMSGDILLQSGFNMVTTTESRIEGLQSITSLVLAAVPGTGLGRFQNCEAQDIVLRRVNGVRGTDAGNFGLDHDLCHFVRQPTTLLGELVVPTAATLKVGNDCGPCCTCDEFVNVYRAFTNIYEQYRELGIEYMRIRDELVAAVSRFNLAADCQRQDVLDLVALAHDNIYIEVAVSLCNATGACSRNVEIRLRFFINNPTIESCVTDIENAGSPVVDISSCSVIMSSPFGEDRGTTVYDPTTKTWNFFWDYVNPGGRATARFRALTQFCMAEASSVTIEATAFVDGVPAPLTAPQTREITISPHPAC